VCNVPSSVRRRFSSNDNVFYFFWFSRLRLSLYANAANRSVSDRSTVVACGKNVIIGLGVETALHFPLHPHFCHIWEIGNQWTTFKLFFTLRSCNFFKMIIWPLQHSCQCYMHGITCFHFLRRYYCCFRFLFHRPTFPQSYCRFGGIAHIALVNRWSRAVWRSDNALGSIDKGISRRPRLVLGWVTDCRPVNYLGIYNQPPRSTQSGHPSLDNCNE